MKLSTGFRFFFIGCLVCGCADNSPTSNDDDDTGAKSRSASSTVTPASGGSVTVENDRGDIIKLTLPPNSVTESTVIKLTTRTESPENPYSTSVFPGINIEPDGLVLGDLATLSVTFADPPDSIEYCALYLADAPDYAILLDYFDDTETTIGGDIVLLGEYGSCLPTSEEVAQQSDLVESDLEQLDVIVGKITGKYYPILSFNDPLNWRKAYSYAGWALQMIRLSSLIGNDDRAKDLKKKLDEKMEDTIKKFLDKKVDDMCDPQYKQALTKYTQMVLQLGLSDSTNFDKKIEEKMAEMMDRCSSRFQLDIAYEQTSQIPNGNDVIQYDGTVEFYIPYYTKESGDYGQLKGEGSLSVTGGGYSQDKAEVCNWTTSGKIDVAVGGNVDFESVNDLKLNIELTFTYNIYQNKECCYDGDCHDLSGSTMVGPGPGFTLVMPIEDGHTIQQPFGAGISTGVITYTLHVLNNMFN